MMTGPEAVLRFEVLDTAPEAHFNDIVTLATQLCGTPTALVSLLDTDRQWFKARTGFACSETDLDRSVCRHVVAEGETLVIPDLTLDRRTSANPLVTGEPHIRFYAGAPLETRHGPIGALCVIDTVPRPEGLTEAQQQALESLARQVVMLLEARIDAAALKAELALREASERSVALTVRRRDALLALGDMLRDQDDEDAMVTQACEIVGKALDASRAAYGELNHDRQIVNVRAGWSLPGMPSVHGRHMFESYGEVRDDLVAGKLLVVDDVALDARTKADIAIWENLKVRSVVNVPVRDHGSVVAILIVHRSNAHRWSEDEIGFLRNVADRLEIAIARLRAVEQQRILNGEIAHRLKNTLAMVQAVASQTLRKSIDPSALDEFMRRLQALGTAHDALTSGRWQGTDMRSIVTGALAALGLETRCEVGGPEVAMGARAALSTSMLIHELATNASKYGALSTDNGVVTIRWDVDGADDPSVELRWTERGGPAVHVPTQKGFGSKLIRLGLAGTGGSDVRYGPQGFEASFKARVEELGQA